MSTRATPFLRSVERPQHFQSIECFSLAHKYERVAFIHLPGVSVRRADEGRNGPGFGAAYVSLSRDVQDRFGSVPLCSSSSLCLLSRPMPPGQHRRVLAIVRAIAATPEQLPNSWKTRCAGRPLPQQQPRPTTSANKPGAEPQQSNKETTRRTSRTAPQSRRLKTAPTHY